MFFKTIYRVITEAFMGFLADDAMTLAAAFAFYAGLAAAPLLILLVSTIGLLGPDTQHRLIETIQSLTDPKTHQVIQSIITKSAQQRYAATVSAALGLIVLVVSATGAFAQLQYSLNRIWGVQAKSANVLWDWLRKRITSLLLVFCIALLLLASIAITAALHFLVRMGGSMWTYLNFFVSLAVFILLFALIYKYLPDVIIAWHDVWIGAALTALLFVLGRYFISEYLGRTTFESAYGAAGSFAVLLVWVYYNSLILFFGVELTKSYARCCGEEIVPQSHAEWISERDREASQESHE